MQIVSENWKNAHKQALLNESFVEISFDVSDPDALNDASPSDNGAIYLSETHGLTDGIDKNSTPYCTLEQNIWLLNGRRKSIPETISPYYRFQGYVSDALSDETCVFGEKIPTITLTFTETHSNLIPGITITWGTVYNEFPTEFVIRAYNDNTLVAEKEILNNRSVKSLVQIDIANYNRIIIYVKKWCLPHHRARIDNIFLGINKVYSKSDLFSYSHKQSVCPISTTLPKNEIKFSINNVDGEFNPYNASGMSKYLMDRQVIKVRYGLKTDEDTIEWIKGGTFYLSEWSAEQNGLTANFTARDLFELMSATTPTGTLPTNDLWGLATELFNVANFPDNHTSDGQLKWDIDFWEGDYSTQAPLPNDSIANCLQLIANATECVLYQDRDGIVHMKHLEEDDEDSDYLINSFNSYSKPEITLSKPIKQVDVKVYTYTESDRGFESTTTTVTIPVGTQGEVITVDNPLITDTERATSVGNWMARHLSRRIALDSSWRADVRLDALDIVGNENAYTTHKVRMTDVEFRYNGAFRGTGKGKVI